MAHERLRVLESLARGATAAGDAAGAVIWWRKLAAADPLNARTAIGLMEALAAAGDLAGALLRLGHPAEAVTVVQGALRGGVEASALYTSRTELHELLALAWEAAGGADSAAFHVAIVARIWGGGDPPYRARAAAAAARAVALSRHR